MDNARAAFDFLRKNVMPMATLSQFTHLATPHPVIRERKKTL